MADDGTARPSGGTIQAFEAPSGPGLRTDTYGYVGYTTNPGFDSLLAKVIGHARSHAEAIKRTRRALGEFRIEGVNTNIGFLQALLDRPEVVENNVTTTFVTENAAAVLAAEPGRDQRYFALAAPTTNGEEPGLAGARVDANDPLAVLTHGSIDKPTGDPTTGPTAVRETAPARRAPLDLLRRPHRFRERLPVRRLLDLTVPSRWKLLFREPSLRSPLPKERPSPKGSSFWSWKR